MIKTLQRSVQFHLRQLTRLTAAEKLNYLAFRTQNRFGRKQDTIPKPIIELYRKFGNPVPFNLRYHNLRDINLRASRKYIPQAYGSRLTDIETVSDQYQDSREFWNKVITGGIEVHAIPGKDDQIFKKPVVYKLADKLRICMNHADMG